MRIVGIGGSLRVASYNAALLRADARIQLHPGRMLVTEQSKRRG